MDMQDQSLRPERITKPIQLLGAWLAGLLAINSSFLVAAVNIGNGTWEAGALVVASIVNVPLFLIAVFVLQTRFRPELQEDSYYSTYLNSKTDEPIRVSKIDAHFSELHQSIAELRNKIVPETSVAPSEGDEIDESLLSSLTIGVNRHLEDAQQIKTSLKERGVLGVAPFGAANPPNGRNVSVSQYLSKREAHAVIKLAHELGFSSFNFFDNRAEGADEDVLLGSYGEPEYEL